VNQTRRLDGRVALVTGASRGLGRHIALRLAEDGARVCVNYAASHEGAEETVRLIRSSGGEAHSFCADVTENEAVDALVGRVTSILGQHIEIVVNNASGPQPLLAVEESTWDDYLDQLRFFVKAPLLVLQAVLPAMREARDGSIVNIGSEVVQLGSAPFATYVAAKAAMTGLTRSWARELAPAGIRVNLVAPGWIPVERHIGSDTSAYEAQVPLGHLGEPLDIANAVVFLASAQSKFITGQCLTVNGGNSFT
jgi:3-oxoacyl-[acyl-carrier protein] reductase